MTPRTATLGGIALVCVAAVAAAVTIQHTFDYQPCPWCVLQRLIFLAVALAALVGLAWRTLTGLRLSSVLVISAASSGATAALWQHFVAASTDSCDLTLADRIVGGLGIDERWPWLFAAYASCKDAAVKLLGVYFEFYSLALFVAIALAALWLLARSFNAATR